MHLLADRLVDSLQSSRVQRRDQLRLSFVWCVSQLVSIIDKYYESPSPMVNRTRHDLFSPVEHDPRATRFVHLQCHADT